MIKAQTSPLYQDLERILLTESEIKAKVEEIGAKLTEDYRGKEPVMVCILKGSTPFFADLIRNVDLSLTLDFMSISSYGNATRSSGVVRVMKDLDKDIVGKDVIVVEDIIDSGLTLSFLAENLRARGAASLSICTLLDKPSRRAPGVTLKADYSGFEVENEFVVGYGLDYAERYRNLPYIGVLKPEIYE